MEQKRQIVIHLHFQNCAYKYVYTFKGILQTYSNMQKCLYEINEGIPTSAISLFVPIQGKNE